MPSRPTKGAEVLRIVDKHGSISFAGTGYRVGNRTSVRLSAFVWPAILSRLRSTAPLLRTHRARHDRSKEFGALAQPNGKLRRNRDGVA